MGKRERIAQAARQLECLLIIGARLAVIASSPQKAKGNETLPLSGKVMDRVSNLQCTLIVTACLFKFAQGFIGLSACKGDLWAGNSPQVVGGIDSQGKNVAEKALTAAFAFPSRIYRLNKVEERLKVLGEATAAEIVGRM